jgi:Uma2 family endonuclease
MRTVIVGDPPHQLAAWLEERRARGLDLFDEVWEGEYHVAPAPRPRHGMIDAQLAERLGPRARAAGLIPAGPVNIGELGDFRVPDRVFMRAHPTETYVPTAAIVVEIVSPGDETYEKFPFYFSRGVEELLVVDSSPGAVEWYARGADGFERTGRSRLLGVTEEELAAEIEWPPGE